MAGTYIIPVLHERYKIRLYYDVFRKRKLSDKSHALFAAVYDVGALLVQALTIIIDSRPAATASCL